MRRKHWPWRGSGFPAGLRKGASIDRGRPTALPEAMRSWVGSTRWAVLQHFGSELHGGMSLTTSADHALIIEAGGESVKVKQEGERMQDAAGGEGGRKSAAGRNPVKGFPSRVWKGSQVSHLWLNRRSLGIDRLDPITRPLSWLGQQTVGTHPRTKGALRITGGPPAGRRIPMGSLIVLEQEHQATHGEGKRRGRNTSTTLKSRKHRTS